MTVYPRAVSVIRSVGVVTFREILGDKVLYNVIFCSVLLFGVGFLASRLTFVQPERIIIDFGITALVVSCAMLGALVGAGLVVREFERRTVWVALSRPISRFHFVLGKFVGLAGILGVHWLLLTAALALMIWGTAGDLAFVLNSAFAWAVTLAFLQGLLMAAVAVFFSTFSTVSLAVIISIGVFLVGTNVSQMRLVAQRIQLPWVAALVRWFAAAVPNLEYFSLGTQATYGLHLPWGYGLGSVGYGLFYICFLLGLAGLMIEKRES
jgi:ABC-type transport system involved in multi-copper enzyme maturation permease subunit